MAENFNSELMKTELEAVSAELVLKELSWKVDLPDCLPSKLTSSES